MGCFLEGVRKITVIVVCTLSDSPPQPKWLSCVWHFRNSFFFGFQACGMPVQKILFWCRACHELDTTCLKCSVGVRKGGFKNSELSDDW